MLQVNYARRKLINYFPIEPTPDVNRDQTMLPILSMLTEPVITMFRMGWQKFEKSSANLLTPTDEKFKKMTLQIDPHHKT